MTSGSGESGSPRAPATAALGVALILAGLGFDLVGALACGIALLALAVGAFAWVELASLGGRLEREPGPARMEEGEPYPLRLRLRRTLLPPPGGELSDPLLERKQRIGPRWRRRLDREVWLSGPGRRRLEPARLVVADPLGLWRRELRSERTDQLVVLPRVEPIRALADGGLPGGGANGSGNGNGTSSRRNGVSQLEVDGLRPYRDGSPASRIHWPAVARTGEMIERRLVAGGDPKPLVVFDPRGADRGACEEGMRTTASLCVALARDGGCELLLPGERRTIAIDPAMRAWPEAHVRIAVCDLGAAPLLSPQPRAAAVIWVSAAGALPAGLRRLPPGSLLVTPRRRRGTSSFEAVAA